MRREVLVRIAPLAVAALLGGCGESLTGDENVVVINGGQFLLGSARADVERLALMTGGADEVDTLVAAEQPPVKAAVQAFRLDKLEVTNFWFGRFVAANPQWAPGAGNALAGEAYLSHWSSGAHPPGQADFPVIWVSWHAAQAYCAWAGGRLPTEAEWEYSARAGGTSQYPWGDSPPNPSLANYRDSSYGAPTVTGSYPPTGYGVFDLAGNVAELTLDTWRDRPLSTESAALVDVSAGAIGASPRVVRGGSFQSDPLSLRTRTRRAQPASEPSADTGFRCAYDGVI